MKFFRHILKRTDSFIFSIGILGGLYGVVAGYNLIYPSGLEPLVLRRDDGYSDYTISQIVRLHQGLWNAHLQTERELSHLEKEDEEGFFIKEFKWKGTKASVTVGTPQDAEFSQVQSLWPHRILTLKKLEKKKNTHYIQVEFCLSPFFGEKHECPAFTFKSKENFCELAESFDIILDSWSYTEPSKSLRSSCDRLGRVCFRGTMQQRSDFLTALEQHGWILGQTGRCYAKTDFLVFDFELLHLCRPLDSPSTSESIRGTLL